MPTSTIPSKSLFVVSPSSSSTSANIESPVVPREWSVTGYHSYLKAVQLISIPPLFGKEVKQGFFNLGEFF